MKGWKIAIVVVLLGVIALFWRGLYLNPRDIPSVLVGKPAASFSAEDFQGKTWRLEDLRGKVVVLNFWASWCAECIREHANLLRLHEMFGANPDFVMLGVVYQDKEEDARAFLRQAGSSYPALLDPKGEVGIGYGVYGVPETFVIDRAGVIRCKQAGPIMGNQFDKVAQRWIAPLLQGKELISCD